MSRRGKGLGTPDRELTSALRALPVPEHTDDFFDRLRGRLVAESLDSNGAPSDVTHLSAVRRAAGTRRPQRLRRLLTMATAPAAAVACFALVVGGAVVARKAGDGGSGQLQQQSVALVGGKKVPRQLVSVAPYAPAKHGVRIAFKKVDIDRDHPARPEITSEYEATVSEAGDYRITRRHKPLEIVHSAKTSRRLMYLPGDDSPLQDQFGLSNGPPEPEPSTPDRALSRDLGAAVRAIAVLHPERVTKTTHLGREALVLQQPIELSDFPVDSIKYVVDVKTGFPLQIVQTNQGAFYREMNVTAIADVPLDQSAFEFVGESGLAPAPVDRGHRDVTLDEAAQRTQHAPLVPSWAPKGYRLTRVTLAPELAKLDDNGNPPSREVVSLLYRRGLDTFTVTTRLTSPTPDEPLPYWSNPLLHGTPLPDRTEPVRISSGALTGTEVNVGVYPLVWPHLWAQTDNLVLTVAGDLTREELVRIAGSLEKYEAR